MELIMWTKCHKLIKNSAVETEHSQSSEWSYKTDAQMTLLFVRELHDNIAVELNMRNSWERNRLMWFSEWDSLNLFNDIISTDTTVPSERIHGNCVRAASYFEIRDFGKFEYTFQRLINIDLTLLWIHVNITLLADYAWRLQGIWLLYINEVKHNEGQNTTKFIS
jgi:hypothetical protein